MGVAVAIGLAELSVTPGEEAVNEVRIRNTGAVVDQIELDVLGEAAGWATVDPPRVNLLPGEAAIALVTFAPPRNPKVTAGQTPYALRAMSREDTAGSVIEEASVTVEPFGTIVAEILPRTSQGSRSGRHQLAIDNLGNQPLEVTIVPSDPDQFLDFRVEPSGLTAAPGTATFVKVHALPRKRYLRGGTKTLPFQVTVLAQGAEPVTVPGALLQKPILPKWLPKAVLVVVAALVALLVLWQTMLKPEVRSTARAVAKEETAPLAAQVAAATQTAETASANADAAKAAAGLPTGNESTAKTGKGANGTETGQAAGKGAGAGAGITGATLDPEAATDFRIVTDAAAAAASGTFETFRYTPPEGKLVWISDMVLQNPRGDSGILQIRRGAQVLFEFGLANFRDLDYHLIQPMRFSNPDPVVVAVECQNTGTRCTPAVYFTGQTSADPAAEPKPKAPKSSATSKTDKTSDKTPSKTTADPAGTGAPAATTGTGTTPATAPEPAATALPTEPPAGLS